MNNMPELCLASVATFYSGGRQKTKTNMERRNTGLREHTWGTKFKAKIRSQIYFLAKHNIFIQDNASEEH
jgi:hypothetical protein